MNITLPVIVSWLLAVWWLVAGIRDFSLIRYNASGSARYRKVLPLILCVSGSVNLALLGYFFSINHRQFLLLTLFIFVVIWVLWSLVAKRSWSKTTHIE